MTRPTEDLSGKAALVTGATSGIGAAAAIALAAAGADVIVVGRDRRRGDEVLDRIAATGGTARFIAADLADLGSLQGLVDAAGDVDVLVNNAGLSIWGATGEFAIDDLDALLALNVRAPFFLVRAFAGAMAQKGEGSIVNVSSMAASVGLVGAAAYGATKAALDALTRSWATEYAPSGVRINSVAPGPTYSNAGPREVFDAIGATVPLNRVAEPAEIAEIIVFLASARASYATGGTFAVDGGRTAA
ncbi:SDR family NAD(P)-dependent oxidoreductase [Conexibacter sp. CPCC 206217]|uniref:SDR family NAD(P)-dependent oxidoreductase n=1 Tax=Conexibacter sp. CPCC 206217 TaxID=3064574 RepID=UPI00271C243F|nr:SDR family oxidoreductase [Conexibacter sp. CPCC 206217]MDO8212038.1 SDR family oxidoreductase [Conexibacter sp. CPCC 206217]